MILASSGLMGCVDKQSSGFTFELECWPALRTVQITNLFYDVAMATISGQDNCRCPKCLNLTDTGDGSHAGDEPLDSLVDRTEGVLAQHGPLGLVVELEVHPVDGEVAALLLGPADELAAQLRPGGLRREGLGLEDVQVPGDPVHGTVAVEQVVQAATAADVVVGQVQLGD